MKSRTGGGGDRLLALLGLLIERGRLSVTEAAQLLEIDRSNAYRNMKKLEEYGFAARTGRRYVSGRRFLPQSFLTPYAVAEFSREILHELVRTTGASAHLCVLSPHGATFAAQENAAGPICVSQPIGKEEPFHCTASGKAMLAFLPEPMRGTFIEEIGFERFTERTIGSREELEEQLALIRECGYAVDEGEYHPNLACICVPVFDSRGVSTYALGLSKPMLPDRTLDYPKVYKPLERCAAQISEFLCAEADG